MSIWKRTKYVLALTLFISASYFAIQNLVTTHVVDFLLPIDKEIPFIPEFVWVYNTLLPMLMLSSIFLIKNRTTFLTAALSFFTAAMVLNMFYILLPSFYPREPFEVTSISTWLLEITKQIDGSNNTFPSGHVALSWLLFLNVLQTKFAENKPLIKVFFFLWSSSISISTLVLKQHYIVDVAGGIVLAVLCFWASKKYIKNNPAVITAGSNKMPTGLPQLAE